MIKLQPGDYVSTKGMTEEQYHAVCKAFMDAGAEEGEYPFLAEVGYFNYFGWKKGQGIFRFDGKEDMVYFHKLRELTVKQLLGAKGTGDDNMNLQEAYKVMQANCGIEVGDTVKVLRKAQGHELGWDNTWTNAMDAFIDKICVVKYIGNSGIHGYNQELDNWYLFPFFVLELVKKAPKLPAPIRISPQYKAEFKEDGSIAVGCQRLSFDMIENIYLTAKEVKEKS